MFGTARVTIIGSISKNGASIMVLAASTNARFCPNLFDNSLIRPQVALSGTKFVLIVHSLPGSPGVKNFNTPEIKF